MPADVVDTIEKIPDKRQREAIVEEMYRPFSMGATDFAFDEKQLKNGRRLPRKIQQELRESTRRMVPGLNLEVAIDGHPLALTLILQARPLVVDVMQKVAYYPITAGFVLVPKAKEKENILSLMAEPWTDPASWALADQKQFWTKVVAVIRKWGEQLAPAKPTPVRQAVLTISAKLNVAVDTAKPDQADAALDRIVAQLRKAGHVVEMKHAWSGEAPATQRFSLLLSAVKQAKTPAKKGKALESFVRAIFTSIPGFSVRGNQHTETEEIDLVIINQSDEARWRDSGPLILVECKNWASASGKNEIVQFRDKLVNRYGQCGLGFFISWQGFAQTVTKDSLRNSRDGPLIVPVDGRSLEKACETGQFLSVLCDAWDAAVLT